MTAEPIFTAVPSGSYSISSVRLDAFRHQNASIFVWGTWGGATATITVSPDGVNFFPFAGNTLTTNGFITLGATHTVVLVTLTGGTGVSLNAVLN